MYDDNDIILGSGTYAPRQFEAENIRIAYDDYDS